MARELGLSKDDAERKPRAKPKPKGVKKDAAGGGSGGAGRKRRPASAAASSDDNEDGDWADAEYEAPKAKRRRRAKAAAAPPEAPREKTMPTSDCEGQCVRLNVDVLGAAVQCEVRAAVGLFRVHDMACPSL